MATATMTEKPSAETEAQIKELADKYAYQVEWSDEDGEYVATVAEMPGLSWLDPDMAKALDGIRMVTREGIEILLEDGEEPPEPFALRDYSGTFTVRIPPSEHRRLAVQAAREGVSLNRLASEKLAA